MRHNSLDDRSRSGSETEIDLHRVGGWVRCVCKENNKLIEKYLHRAKLQFEWGKIQFCLKNRACTKANASQLSRWGSMHVKGKIHAACILIKPVKDSARERPAAFAQGFDWRTSPRRWPRSLYRDACGPPPAANRAPEAPSVAPTEAPGPLREAAGRNTKPPTHVGGFPESLWRLRVHPDPHTCGHTWRTPTSRRPGNQPHTRPRVPHKRRQQGY